VGKAAKIGISKRELGHRTILDPVTKEMGNPRGKTSEGAVKKEKDSQNESLIGFT